MAMYREKKASIDALYIPPEYYVELSAANMSAECRTTPGHGRQLHGHGYLVRYPNGKLELLPANAFNARFEQVEEGNG